MQLVAEGQLRNIKSMLHSDEDQAILDRHLRNADKKQLKDLTTEEGAMLIKELLQQDCEYRHVCGRKVRLKREKGRQYQAYAEMACNEACPIGLTVGSCIAFEEYELSTGRRRGPIAPW